MKATIPLCGPVSFRWQLRLLRSYKSERNISFDRDSDWNKDTNASLYPREFENSTKTDLSNWVRTKRACSRGFAETSLGVSTITFEKYRINYFVWVKERPNDRRRVRSVTWVCNLGAYDPLPRWRTASWERAGWPEPSPSSVPPFLA